MPDALISRMTSLGPGVGSGNSLSSNFRSPRKTTPFMVSSGVDVRVTGASAVLEGAAGGNDDLGSVGLLAEHRDLGARLTALGAATRDDPTRSEGLVRPQHVGEFHVQVSAQIESTTEMPGQELGDARERHAATNDRIAEAELLRGFLVVVVVPALVEKLVAHRFAERLPDLQ